MKRDDTSLTTEIELKLQLPSQDRETILATLEAAGWERLELEAHYFDTPDGLLAGHGMSLRVRREDRRWLQTLKAAGGSAVRRLEHEVELPPPPDSAAPRPDLARHEGTPAGEALAALGAGELQRLRAELTERHATRIERRRGDLAVGSSCIEAVLDQGEIRAGGRVLPVYELELELKSGRIQDLTDLARRWVRELGLHLSTISKAQRGERLSLGQEHGPAVKAGAPALERSMTPTQVLRAVVGNCLEQILPNASELAAGSDREEHVHQLRVGIRRLRTALREVGRFSDGVDPGWEPALVAVFRRLGELRDQTSVASAVQPKLEAAGAPTVDWPSAPGALPDPGATVREADFQEVLIDLLRFSLEEGDAAGEGRAAKRARGLLRARLRKLHRRVAHEGARFTELPAEEQHRVRKRLKRLRYVAEFAAPVFGAQAVERYVGRLRPAQDALGAHNDDAVAIEAYRRAAQEDPRAWFAVGWLGASQLQTARECRKALRTAARARRFWKK